MLAGVDYFDQGKAANTKIISKKNPYLSSLSVRKALQ